MVFVRVLCGVRCVSLYLCQEQDLIHTTGINYFDDRYNLCRQQIVGADGKREVCHHGQTAKSYYRQKSRKTDVKKNHTAKNSFAVNYLGR